MVVLYVRIFMAIRTRSEEIEKMTAVQRAQVTQLLLGDTIISFTVGRGGGWWRLPV